jgi:hypothetical protein
MEAINRVRMSWSLCALAALIASALNPTFVPKLVFSSYADGPTAIAIGFAGMLSWLMLNALSEGDETAARSLAWQSSLALTAAIGLKQVNLIFLIALAIAITVIALRDPGIRFRTLLKIAPLAFILPLVVYVLWRIYVGQQLSGGEQTFRPQSEWLVTAIPEILGRMASVASKKGGYFGIMLVAVLIALRALPSPRTAFDRLAILTASMFLTYNGFLLVSYVTIFTEWEARNAASYWRYNTHLGGVCLLFAAYSGALLWRKYVTRSLPRWAGALAIFLIVAIPFAMGKKLRFDSHPRYDYGYSTGGDIANQLSADDRLFLIDLEDNGQFLVIMRYKMHGSARVSGELSSFFRRGAKKIRSRLKETTASHVWIYETDPRVEEALGLNLKAGASHLLARNGDGWVLVRSWPHPVGP